MEGIEKFGPYEAFTPNEIVAQRALNEAFEYGILSFPFTFNRMNLVDCSRRILNIIKGKLAERYFLEYLNFKKIKVKTDENETPFYTTDYGDLTLNGLSVDLKNNFLKLNHEVLKVDKEFLDKLPALIPNKDANDQWQRFLKKPNSIAVFTFMLWSQVNKGKVRELFSLNISNKQKDYLKQLYVKYRGMRQSKSPYSESSFWEQWKALRANEKPEIKVNFTSPLYVCAYTGKKDIDRFKTLPPRTFSKKVIITRIINQAAPIAKLKPFSAFES